MDNGRAKLNRETQVKHGIMVRIRRDTYRQVKKAAKAGNISITTWVGLRCTEALEKKA